MTIALFPPFLFRTSTLSVRVSGGLILRATISFAVAAAAFAASLSGAAAQYYPPQPPPVYPSYPNSAPSPPPDQPRTYSSTPLAPPPYVQPGYVPPGLAARPAPGYGYGQQPPPAYGQEPPPGYSAAPPAYGQGEAEAYPPPSRPYFAPDGALPPQPMPDGDAPALRPPGSVYSAPAAPPAPEVTGTISNQGPPPAAAAPNSSVIAGLPPDDQPEQGPPKPLPPQFRRQLVDYVTKEPAGTIIVDTPNTYLYLVLGKGKALRYGIGVGREGFTWTGTERVSRMKEWPDWFPPKEMIERQPYLPRFMAGGESNPLGARALYLGNTLYRIHGTNQPSTIGSYVSSGCIRLTNEDIEDLYGRVNVGTRVVVLPGAMPPNTASVQGPISH
jgi:lipoprotein-anchoring transpeptidase ErfK/SrfK